MVKIGMLLLGGTLSALSGCANQTRSAGAPEGDVPAPCAVRATPSDSAPWREAQGDGFTFCVPADWRASGPNSWRGGGGDVTWHVGDGARVPFTVRRGSPGMAAMPADNWETTETIGGESVSLGTGRAGSKYSARADWNVNRIHFRGTAASSGEAQRHLEIYRTVRTK